VKSGVTDIGGTAEPTGAWLTEQPPRGRAREAHTSREAWLESLFASAAEAMLVHGLEGCFPGGESALDKLLGHVLCLMSQRLGAQGVSLWLRDRASELPVFHLSFKEGRIATEPEADHPVVENRAYWQESPMGQELLRTKKAVLCDDVEHDPRVAAWRDYLRAQGTRTVLAVPLLAGGRVIGLISLRCARPRAYQAQEMELAQALAHQATLAIELTRLAEQSRQAAVFEERNRLARDIHDTLAQGFTGIIVQLEAAEDAMLRGETLEANGHLRRIGKLARQSLAEARRSVQALRPQALEEGNLAAALERLLHQMTPGSGLQAQFSLAGCQRPLPPEWEENLLRIGQEALTNTLKHAQASRFVARLVFAAHGVRLEIQDDGRGFEVATKNGGLGLTGMKERVARLGGRLTLRSAPGQGTRIRVALPDHPAAQTATL
jgi:signal transduction histidine kinase